MMRQILALVLVMAFAGALHASGLEEEFDNLPAKPARKSARVKRSPSTHKRLDEMHTTQDRWDELQTDNALQHDDEREAYRAPVRARRAASRPAATRVPASVPSALPSNAPAQAIFPVASLSFDEYLAENGRNPALNRRIPDHQKAFADTSGPAVISLPDSDSNSTSSSSASSANPAAAAGGNAGAIQAAAAAAAAAGLIPAGAVGGAASSSTSAPAGPVR